MTKFKIFSIKISFLVILLTSSIFSFSQQLNLNQKITINSKNESLGNVLAEITKKANINFTYSNQQIDTEQKVTLVARNKTVSEIFEILFLKINIEYIVIEKQIVLKPLKSPSPALVEKIDIQNPEEYTISGYIKDNLTGEALISANIYLVDNYTGTITNEYGYYSLTLPEGDYKIGFSYVGYNLTIEEITLKSNVVISKELELNEAVFEVIIVTRETVDDILEINPTKNIDLNSKIIKKTIGLGGEADFNKTIQSIPGINSFGDGSVYFYVRGGNKDQNLIYIDEAPIYNPSHLLGFFSAVAPEVINNIKLYKNDFPIQYGGRLSSIVDIKVKDGNLNKFGFSGIITPLTGSYTFEGPFKKEKSSYLLNLRNSHINWLFKNFFPSSTVKFYDFHLKINFILNSKNRIYFSIFSGYDLFKISQTAMSWKNFASTFRWNHLFSDKLFSNLTLYTSKYDYFLYTSFENKVYWNSFIGNLSLKYDFTLYPNPENTAKFGFNINSHFFNPGNLNSANTVFTSNVSEIVFYLSDEATINDKFTLNYGGRLLSWNNLGPSKIYDFDENYNVVDTLIFGEGNFNSIPSLEFQTGILYAFNKKNSLKISINHYVQNLHLLSNSVSPFTTLDVWLPSGLNIKPQKVNQVSIGYFKKFVEMNFTLETFYKKFKNQIEYADHANMLLNPLIEGELRFGTAKAFGIEFSLEKQKGNFTFAAAYSYSRVLRYTEGINFNRVYPAVYDKPHNINFNISYNPNSRLNFSCGWFFSSGMRFSSPTSFYYYNGSQIPVYTEKNNSKLPDYHRLDANFSFRLNKNDNAKFSHKIILSIFNIYGRKNIMSINFNKFEDENKFLIPVDFVEQNQLLSTQISLLGIVPSITYSFNFR
jgi:hypothetical protein